MSNIKICSSKNLHNSKIFKYQTKHTAFYLSPAKYFSAHLLEKYFCNSKYLQHDLLVRLVLHSTAS